MVSPSIRYSIISNAIEQVTTTSGEEAVLTSFANLGYRTTWEVGMALSLWGVKWMFFTFRPYYQHLKHTSTHPDVGTNRVQSLNLTTNIEFSPWMGGSISCEYGYRPAIIVAQSAKVRYYHNVGFYLHQSFLKNKFFATLSLSNPFESRRYISNTISGSGFIYTDRREQLGRVWSLSVRANFGRFKDRIVERGDIIGDRERP